MDKFERNLIKGTIGLGLFSFALGAIRGYQEAIGIVTDPTLDSKLIEMAIAGPIGVGILTGTAVAIPAALDSDGVEHKIGLPVGGATIGFTVSGVAAYSGTPLGYAAGKIAGYIASNFTK